MKLSSIEPHIVKEARDKEATPLAKDISPRFQINEVPTAASSSKEKENSAGNEAYYRSDPVIDFVAKARKKKAELLGKKRLRAIRSYSSIASFEDSFIFKGRFYRNA